MSSGSSIIPLLQAAAPRLARRFFSCQPCAAKPAQIHNLANARTQYRSLRQTPFLKAFPAQSTAATSESASPIAKLSKNITSKLPRKKTATFASSFPEVSSQTVSYWLFGSAASVFGIVIFGGLTRLTESGYARDEEHCSSAPQANIFQSEHHGMASGHRQPSTNVRR